MRNVAFVAAGALCNAAMSAAAHAPILASTDPERGSALARIEELFGASGAASEAAAAAAAAADVAAGTAGANEEGSEEANEGAASGAEEKRHFAHPGLLRLWAASAKSRAVV